MGQVQYQKLIAVSALLLGFWSVGCSEVTFSPSGTDRGSLNNPDPVDGKRNRTEVFFINDQRPLTKVDVLFVVDNSASMLDEQQKLATRLASFVNSLVGVDWQIAITTTDLSGGPYSSNGRIVDMVGTAVPTKILTRSTPNYEKVFLDTVTANGTDLRCESDVSKCASGDEQPLEATRLAITKRNTDNLGFFRQSADFVTIVLSDEDELSTGDSVYDPTTAEDVLSLAKIVWGEEKNVTGFGIIIKPFDSACYNSQYSSGGNYGDFVQHFANITKGETGSICAGDYGPALSSIGQRVKKYATTIGLSAMPVAGTVKVTLLPEDPSISWEVIGQSIRLSDIPAMGTKVTVTYDLL